MSWLASLPGVEALSTFASHWLVHHDDLTVVTMGMDETWGNQQQSKETKGAEGEEGEQEREAVADRYACDKHTHSEMPQILQPKPCWLHAGLKSLYTRRQQRQLLHHT